jgi:hypothetical protein
MAGASLHGSKATGFTGPVASYSPSASGELFVKTDTTPNELYRSTGTTAGALVLVGGGPPGAAATLSIDGDVDVLDPGDPGTAVNLGTSSAAILKLALPKGDQGDPGNGINPRGAYNGATTYQIGDSVSSAGSSYVAIAETTGNAPPNATFWQVLAERGTDGADGKTVLSGSGAPSAGLGVNGDFYIDTVAAAIYGPKTAGAWGSPTSLIGGNGADGISGFGLRYTFSTATTSPPASGQLRFNNATYASATSIFVHETDRNSASVAALLGAIADGSPLLVIDENDPGAFAYFTLTSQTDNGSDRTLAVTHVASAGTLTGNVSLTFAARGATGAPGAVTAASALVLEEQGSAPSATTNEIKLANVNNVLQWVNEGGTVFTVPTSRTGVVREQWFGAGAMTPRTTNGAAPATVETTTHDITYDTLDFDQTTSEGACFQFSFPQAWNAGTVKAKFYWTAAAGTGTVIWSLRGGSLADDDALDTAYGTAQAVTDTLIATGDLHITSATAAITIAGSPAVDDWIYFEVSRDVADTLNADARLVGIKLQYTESATEPTAW